MHTAQQSTRRTIRSARGRAWQVGTRGLGALLVLMSLMAAPRMAAGAMIELTSFPGQYDTAKGWRPDFGIPSVGNPYAAPTLAAGQANGQTRLQLGANWSWGDFFNALQGPDQIGNAQESLGEFFNLSFPAGSFFRTEPQLLHDQAGDPNGFDRYIMVAAVNNFNSNSQQAWIAVGVNKYVGSIDDRAGCTYAFDANIVSGSQSTLYYVGEPRIGMSADTVLITANMYAFTDHSFQYAKLWLLSKSALCNDPSQGGCPSLDANAILTVVGFQNADGTTFARTVIPAKSYAGNSSVTYLVSAAFLDRADASEVSTALNLWALDTAKLTITWPGTTVTTALYGTPPDAQQPGTNSPRIGIQRWGTQLNNAVYQPPDGLWTAHTTGCRWPGDSEERSCMQWFQIDPGNATVLQQGSFGYPGAYVYAPAIAANANGDAVLVYNSSSAASNWYVQVDYIGRQGSDPLNTLQGSGFQMQGAAGQGCYQRTTAGNTVSPYSAADLDPLNQKVFWIMGAYTLGHDPNCTNNDWSTGVAAVSFTGAAASSEVAASPQVTTPASSGVDAPTRTGQNTALTRSIASVRRGGAGDTDGRAAK